MVLVDTSVWVNHFRMSDPNLVASLDTGTVVCHPFIIGELACGNLGNRQQILKLFRSLPSAPVVEPNELLEFIESRKLMGRGLGYIDVHLLASAILAGVTLWTDDKRLRAAAKELDVSRRG
jgi:predicted nucleic acid-binding protein